MIDKIKKHISLVFLFIVIILLLLNVLNFLAKPKYWNSGYDGGDTDRFCGLYDLPNDCLDYVTVGVSNSYQSVNPTQIYEKTGYRGYCIGSASQCMSLSKFWINEMLKTQHPKVIFLDVKGLVYDDEWVINRRSLQIRSIEQARWSLDKIKAISSLPLTLEEMAGIYFPLLKYHSRLLNDIDENDFHKFKGNCLNGGWFSFATINSLVRTDIQYGTPDKYTCLEDSTIYEGIYEPSVSKITSDEFDDIYNVCVSNGILLVPIRFPSKAWTEEESKTVSTFLSSYGTDYVDLSSGKDVGIDWNYDSGDAGLHVNFWGATKTSLFLGELLKTLDIQQDNINNASTEYWEKVKKEYQIWECDSLSSTSTKIKAYNYLTSVKNNMDKTVILMSVKNDTAAAWTDNFEQLIQGMGLKGDYVNHCQESYIAIIDGGKVRFEKWDNRQLGCTYNFKDCNNVRHSVDIESAGWLIGDKATIVVDGNNVALNNTGLNIAVLNKTSGKCISSVSINTNEGLAFEENKKYKSDEFEYIPDFIDNGFYFIKPFLNNEMRLASDSVGNIALNEDGECLEFKVCEDGTYVIMDENGLCLGLENGGNLPGTYLTHQVYTGQAYQKWIIFPANNATVNLVSAYKNEMAIDIPNGDCILGTKIWIQNQNYSAAQQFILDKI